METLRASDYSAFDCNQEFSLRNLIHVRKLVEEADNPLEGEELAYRAEMEKLTKKTVLKVKPAAAYQHLACNVI